MRRQPIHKQVWLILFTIGVLVVTHSSAPVFVRFVMSSIFLFFCPGVAFIGLLKIQDLLTSFVLSVCLSMALSILVSEAVLFTNGWSSEESLYILVAITFLGAILQIVAAYLFPSQSVETQPGES